MEKEKNILDSFQKFAEDRLRNHFEELNTRYQNESLSSSQILQKAYEDHQKIYEQELREKKISLLKDIDNVWLKAELENIKHGYLTKLSLK